MMKLWLEQLEAGQNLSADETGQIMQAVLDDQLSEKELTRFLLALRNKGETSEEIWGLVNTLKKVALPFEFGGDLLDTCGTGGDLKNTFNISTAVAFVLAGCDIKVAKHGNRAVSSRSGSADVLKALGVNVEASVETSKHCLEKVGIAFLWAPLYHPALKKVAAVRQKIGKTVFNIIGPLLNPAGAKKQVIGVFDEKLLDLLPPVLKKMGTTKAAVVHGSDGMDELTLTGPSYISWYEGGEVKREIFDPRSVGYDYCRHQDLEGGDAEQNAKRLRRVLKGHSEAIDHCVHLNAALAVMVAGQAGDFKEALLKVQESISSGKAYQKLEELVRESQVKA